VVVVVLRPEERDDRVVGDGVGAARLEAARSRRHAEFALSIAWLGEGPRLLAGDRSESDDPTIARGCGTVLMAPGHEGRLQVERTIRVRVRQADEVVKD
jgi:hypothetical protein